MQSYHFDQLIGDHEKQGRILYDQIILADQKRNVTFYLNGINLEQMTSKIDELNTEQYIDDRGKTSSYHTNFADGSMVHGLISAVQLPNNRYSVAGMLLKFKIKDQKGFRNLTYDQLADLFNYAEYKSADQFHMKYKETLDAIIDDYHICFG
uniref:Uncharacterized protein n=1 Tax=Romanomermis culicivorax TaxID=13658 RepID=A0A915HEW7_ROMCU